VGKSLQVGKKGVKLFLVVDDRILYIENPEENTLTHSLTHTLELKMSSARIQDIKINIQKKVFL
jgi:hypothetical protein